MNKKIYTAQGEIVLETILNQGVYEVKKEYILEKYGSNVSQLFLVAYDWFIKNSQIQQDSKEKIYPIWCFKDKKYARKYTKGHLLTLSVNKERIIYFDQKKWERVLNLDYVTEDKDKYLKFHKDLKERGISSVDEVILTPYYPLLKRQVIDSWKGIFKTKKTKVIGAAVFSIKKKDIIEKK